MAIEVNLTKDDGLWRGDDIKIIASAEGLEVSDSVVKAWITFKKGINQDDPGEIQKIITSVNGANGVILDNGATTHIARLQFIIPRAESALVKVEPFSYLYDVQVLSANGAISTSTYGTASFGADRTKSTS